MACKTEKKEINGHEYSCTQLPASEAIKIQLKLTNILGESLGSVLGALVTKRDEDEDSSLKSALGSLGSKLDSQDFYDLFVKMINTCAKDGKRINFEQEFSGNILGAWEVFIFALQVNYRDFIDGLLSKAQESELLQKLTGAVMTSQASH